MAGFFIKSILIKILNFRVENFYFNRWISNLITFTYTSEKPNRRTSLVFNLKKRLLNIYLYRWRINCILTGCVNIIGIARHNVSCPFLRETQLPLRILAVFSGSR